MRFLQTEKDREFKNIKCSDCTNCSDIRWSLKKRVFLVFVCGREGSVLIIQMGERRIKGIRRAAVPDLKVHVVGKNFLLYLLTCDGGGGCFCLSFLDMMKPELNLFLVELYQMGYVIFWCELAVWTSKLST